MSLAVDLVGYRDARGRFASVRDGGLVAVLYERAAALSAEAEAEFSRDAPRSGKAQHEASDLQELDRTKPFHQSFHGVAVPTAVGFTMTVSTTQPTLALWIRDGTKPHEIRPKNGTFLHWEGSEGGVFARVVHHPGTKANPWEERTRERIAASLELEASRIAASVASKLGGRL